MRKQSLSGNGFEKFRKNTRKEQFLEEMEAIVPWKELIEAIERMLRIHFLPHWLNLSDPAAEEASYDSRVLSRFGGADLGREPVPDETTLCKLRHLLEKYDLGDQLFHRVSPGKWHNMHQTRKGDQ